MMKMNYYITQVNYNTYYFLRKILRKSYIKLNIYLYLEIQI